MDKTAVSARVAAVVGILSLALIAIGAAGSLSEMLSPFVGFRIFGGGVLLGLAALLFGITGVLRTRPGSGRGGAQLAWTGLGIGVLVLLIVGVSAGRGLGSPPIHDITTNTSDPPAFVAGKRLRAESANSTDWDAQLAPMIREAYPDLESISVALPPDDAFVRAERIATSLGWVISESAPAEGRLEAYDESGIFHFIDDVVIRVRPAPGDGSIIDLRSNSRVGQGDVGANAARIRAFRDALTQGN
jgi:uncharacterized protein (DUF1499 family)